MKKKKKRILIYSVLLLISMVFIYVLIIGKKEKKNNDYVTKSECIRSVNNLYAEEIISEKNVKGINSKADYNNVVYILSKIGLEEKLTPIIQLKIGKKEKITREKWTEILKLIIDANGMTENCREENISVYDVDEETHKLISTSGSFDYSQANKKMIYKTLKAVVRDNSIIFVEKEDNKVLLENLLIRSSDGEKICISLNGKEKNILVEGLKEKLEGVMCDISLKKGKVTGLTLKRDSISGKIQAINSDSIEIEGFGKIQLNSNLRLYCSYNSYDEKNIGEIRIGETLRFIVADKIICGIFIDEVPVAENIRVLIKTSGYKDVLHDSAEVTCQCDFDLIYYETLNNVSNEVKEAHKAGDVISFTPDNPIFQKGRIKLIPRDENGKIVLNSVSRNGDCPAYRGIIELSLKEGKIVVINEISVEKYLYAVVPSEMPSSYGVEALKVQAVCARSYAISHLENDKLSAYGAQVDDSTDYQVYNSTPENENSISAVSATYGQVLMCGESIANTYFFATSCGCTTDSTVWGGEPLPYIKGKMLSDKECGYNLSSNIDFDKFIKENYETFDSGNPWYRWNLSMTQAELTDVINSNLSSMYRKYPNNILTLKGEEYVSEGISSVGTVTNVTVASRGDGGIIEELVIEGTDNTIKLIKQSVIRNVINPYKIAINKNDGSSTDTFTTLPSAFFTVDKNDNKFVFYGGGFGHGAGMSQTAVKSMIASGMSYEDILTFFYTDVKLDFAYQ